MINLLELAIEDLESSYLLFSEGKYSNALYHYHQCVEKTIKYLGLSIGGLSESQLQFDIKHDPIKAFKYLLKYLSKETEEILPEFNPHSLTNVKQMIMSDSLENIVNSACENIKGILNAEKIIKEELFATPFDALCDYISQTSPIFLKNISNISNKQINETRIQNQIKSTIFLINYGAKSFEILLMNSLICCKFTPDEFRYPNSIIGNPIEYFNYENPIVKNFVFISNSMKFSIENIKNIHWAKTAT